MANREVYLDSSATTRAFPEVVRTVNHVLETEYGNPSSAHKKGISAEDILKETRRLLAETLQADSEEIIFTSGGTEANNLALIGIAHRYRERGKHIITTTIEHASVLNTARRLEQEGFEVDFIPVDKKGFIDIDELKATLRQDTVLVSIMYVNNEVGSIQPIAEIGRLVKEYDTPGHPLFYHVDGVQALGKLPLDPGKMNIDLLSVSGHKLHGPMGTGALYIARGTELEPLITGGGHERGLRSGTENVPGIAGFQAALREGLKRDSEDLKVLRNLLYERVKEKIPEIRINGPHREGAAPHILNILFPGTKGEVLLHALEKEGVYVSVGSACHKSSEPSHVLLAMGLSEDEAAGALRFSVCHFTTREDIEYAAEKIKECYFELRDFMN